MTTLELVRLVKRFDDVTAVKEINLRIAPGNLVALLGPSGCGKTTTLRMIAGLEQPSDGDILFDNESVIGIAPEKRNIGMVFQRYVLFPHMNVEIDERVAEILKIVQLDGYERRFPSQLSGGQQQRVAIARTVITKPRVLLMDEPLSNLDAKLREEMRAFITRLQKQLGITTLFVTHDQIEAIELADHVGVMFDGNLMQFGTPEDIFNHPKSPRIAEFMGTTNLIQGNLIGKESNESVLETASRTFRVAQAPSHRKGSAVTATVRPEHIELGPPNGVLQGNSFRARIADAVYYGGIVNYKLVAEGLSLQVRDRSLRRYGTGEEVTVTLAKEHLWIFPE
jgi:putative spermidine/putrescine transport system ATP-binding protein